MDISSVNRSTFPDMATGTPQMGLLAHRTEKPSSIKEDTGPDSWEA